MHIKQLKNQVRNLEKILAAQSIEKPYSEVLEMVSAMHGLSNWQTAQALASEGSFPGFASLPYGTRGGVEEGKVCWVKLTRQNGTSHELPIDDLYTENLEALDRQIAGEATAADLRRLDKHNEDPVFLWGRHNEVNRRYFNSDGLYVSDLRDARQTDMGVWKLRDGRKMSFIFPVAYPYPLDAEVHKTSTQSDTRVTRMLDVNLEKVLGQYAHHGEVPDWEWLEDNADYTAVDNGFDGTFEFIFNVDKYGRSLDVIPETLLDEFARARREEAQRICFFYAFR